MKTRLITFDIETYRTRNPNIIERITREQMEKRPAQNVAKELKLAWDTEKGQNARISDALNKTAMDVLIAEPLCVCWSCDGIPYSVEMMRYDERDALALLAEKWNEQAGQETIWCGHNILGFDMSVLLNRWRRWGITPPEWFPQYRTGRWSGRVFDTMKRTPCNNGLGLVSQRDVCEALEIEGAKSVIWDGAPMDGSRVGAAFEAEEYDLIIEYCDADVLVEEALYMRMTADDTYGTYDARGSVAEQVSEIEGDDNLTATQKAVAILAVMEQHGLVPRLLQAGA